MRKPEMATKREIAMGQFGLRPGYLYIILAACLWATIGLFVKLLHPFGVPSEVLLTVRLAIVSLILFIMLMLRPAALSRVTVRDLPTLAIQGVVGMGLTAILYFETVRASTMSMAVFLLYTAPLFVLGAARFFFKEPIKGVKLAALVSSLTGLALLLELFRPRGLPISPRVVLMGIGAGLCYACFSIVGKAAVTRLSSWTVVFYMMAFGTFFTAIVSGGRMADIPLTWPFFRAMAGLIIFSTLLPYTLFIVGLKRLEASRASILSTIEPLVASLIGFIVFAETLSIIQAFGGALIIAGAALSQLKG